MQQSRVLAVQVRQVKVGGISDLPSIGPHKSFRRTRHSETKQSSCRHLTASKPSITTVRVAQPRLLILSLIDTAAPSQSTNPETVQPKAAQPEFQLHPTARGNGDATIKGSSQSKSVNSRWAASQTYLALVHTSPLEGLGTLRQSSHHAGT